MHLPVLVLIAGAVGGLRGLEGVLVNRLQRQVPDDVPEHAGLDEVSLELGVRLTDVPAAERSLVVGELDQGDLCVFLTLRRPVADRQRHLGRGCGRRPRRRRARAQQRS